MWFKKTDDIKRLQKFALSIRRNVIRSLTAAGSGHLGGSLGLADVFTVLYFNVMNHDPNNPNSPERDRLVLSVGHVAPVYYATLAESGYFAKSELLTLRKLGSRLQGHPGKDHGLPRLELSSGSLGQGLSVAVGMALADIVDSKRRKIFCLLGDGELQEGSNWEAAMSAGHYSLNNLIAVVDRNRVQIDGYTKNVMRLEPLTDKWRAFGWDVLQCNGNDIGALIKVFQSAGKTSRPTVIIAETKMGKGVISIEDDYHWHGKAPNSHEAEVFLKELSDQS